LQVRGDFDAAMRLVLEASKQLGIYLVNSINPFRLEGQKTIVWELLQDLEWEAPDWIVVPAGNLGNTSAFGKALVEAHDRGWISKMPRLASIQAHGANPFYRSFREDFAQRHRVSAETVASAIRIRAMNFSGCSHGTRCAAPGQIHSSAFFNCSAARRAASRYFTSSSPAIHSVGAVMSRRRMCSTDGDQSRSAAPNALRS